ncbi:MAG: hypothetical protein HY518_05580 [Candidatus Aenigmarchaeota archaeon]|nr:hypothetical protein [Candidatus Aenigmarchaeota archaeon]
MRTIVMAFVAIVSLAVLVVLFTRLIPGQLAPVCWTSTLNQLDAIGGTRFAKGLLGQDDFRVPLVIAGSCVNRIAFGGVDECVDACEDRGFRGDEEQCLQDCARCGKVKGCFIATPSFKSKWTLIPWVGDSALSYSDEAKLALANINAQVYYSADYQFVYAGEPLRGVKDKVQALCLNFHKEPGSVSYLITTVEPEMCQQGGVR